MQHIYRVEQMCPPDFGPWLQLVLACCVTFGIRLALGESSHQSTLSSAIQPSVLLLGSPWMKATSDGERLDNLVCESREVAHECDLYTIRTGGSVRRIARIAAWISHRENSGEDHRSLRICRIAVRYCLFHFRTSFFIKLRVFAT